MISARPNSFLDRPPYIYFWRPFYRGIVLPFIHPLLAWMRNYFLGHLSARLDTLDANIAVLKASQTALAGRFESRYLDSLGQWSEMEHMLLSSIRMVDVDVQKQSARVEELLKQVTALQNSLQQLQLPIQQTLDLTSHHSSEVQEAVTQFRAIQEAQRGLAQRSEQSLSDNNRTWEGIEKLLLMLLAQRQPADVRANHRSSAANSE